MHEKFNDILHLTTIKFKIMGINDFSPQTSKSKRWSKWIAVLSDSTCESCETKNGKIYEKTALNIPSPPLHLYCRCSLEALTSILAGTATIEKKKRC